MSNCSDNRTGGEVFQQVANPRVNSLQSLIRLRPKYGSEWCVMAYALNKNIVKADGSIDDFHGLMIPLGSFSDQRMAEEHAKNLISLTGHPGIVVSKYATAIPLKSTVDPETIVEVPMDLKGRIIELEGEEYKRDKEAFEAKVKREKEIMQEAELETDPDSIEHYKRQCYLAIKCRANYHAHLKEADIAWDEYKKYETAVREHFAKHPEHDAEWLPYFKQKLTERGEEVLYEGIAGAYEDLRSEMLGLEDCDGGVCMHK